MIGQIIEYAANAQEAWGGGKARNTASEFYSKEGMDLEGTLKDEFGEDLDLDSFWSLVEKNLEQGKVRLIIAGDELRPEVRRMIEYLNYEMRNAEVIGLELSCYGTDSTDVHLVPRVIGQMQASVDRRSSGARTTRWTKDMLLEIIGVEMSGTVADRIRSLLELSIDQNSFIESTAQTPTFGVRSNAGARLFSFYSEGGGYVLLKDNTYAGGAKERDEVVAKLKSIGILEPDLDLDTVNQGKLFYRKIDELDDSEFQQLLDIIRDHCGSSS